MRFSKFLNSASSRILGTVMIAIGLGIGILALINPPIQLQIALGLIGLGFISMGLVQVKHTREDYRDEKRFNQVIAIEPVKDLAESCRLRGVETIENSIESVKSLETEPNIIVSFEVIEHLFSPKDFLLNCKKLMAKNSIIAITCPNYKGFDISTLGLVSESIDAEHINLFNPDSLENLFNSCRFKVLESFTPGELDVDIVRNKIIEGEYNVDNQPFLMTILIDRWDELGGNFQRFLQNNKLSSHMWTVAMKVK